MTENIVAFPKNKIVRELPAIAEEVVQEAKMRGQKNYADAVISDIIEGLVTELSNYGIDIDDEDFTKDFSLSVDSLRAAVYRTMNIPHHLHDFIDNAISMVPQGTPIENPPVELDTKE